VKISELTPVDELWADLDPMPCERCGEIIQDWQPHDVDPYTYTKLCESGRCVWVLCKNCDWAVASFGPIDCPYCGSLGRHPRIRRMRHLYRVKRRHW
jgi:hypothetical protein